MFLFPGIVPFSISLSNIKNLYDEKYDKGSFIKNIILDNILPGDIYLKTRELGFNNEVSRCAILIRTQERAEVSISESVQALFPDKNKDFVININETDIALIKEVRQGNEIRDIEKLARSIVDSLHTEYYINSIIGIGTIVTSVALVIPSMIYSETSLSYLGIINLEAGNITSVGTLIAAGQKSIVANAGYVALFPCLFLCMLMLSFNLFGNGLRDAFNPSLRGSED